MAAAEEFLWRVRNRLHAHAERRSDRLTFDEQESLALSMGYSGAPSRRLRTGLLATTAPSRPAAERFMQDYYLHARAVTRGRERILLRATPAKKRGKPVEVNLGNGVRLFDGQVTIVGARRARRAIRARPPRLRRVRPEASPLLPFAREAIARAASDPAWCAALRASPGSGPLFTRCWSARCRRPAPAAARSPASCTTSGSSSAMIPEFAPVTGRVHHDVYHVYTVDVHSVAARRSPPRALPRQARAGAPAGDAASPPRLRARSRSSSRRSSTTSARGTPTRAARGRTTRRAAPSCATCILPRLGLSAEDTLEARAPRRRSTSRCTTSPRAATSTTRPRLRSSAGSCAGARGSAISSS